MKKKTEKISIRELVYKYMTLISILIILSIEIPWRRWKGSNKIKVPEILEYLHMKAADSTALNAVSLYVR